MWGTGHVISREEVKCEGRVMWYVGGEVKCEGRVMWYVAGEVKRIQDFGAETWRKGSLWRDKHRLEDKIKIDFKVIEETEGSDVDLFSRRKEQGAGSCEQERNFGMPHNTKIYLTGCGIQLGCQEGIWFVDFAQIMTLFITEFRPDSCYILSDYVFLFVVQSAQLHMFLLLSRTLYCVKMLG